MLNVPTFGYKADIYTTIHFTPHACQYITVDQSHSSGDTVAKILMISGEWWRHKDGAVFVNEGIHTQTCGHTTRVRTSTNTHIYSKEIS
jgi:hypothetical protein